jgi:hypothetical protein
MPDYSESLHLELIKNGWVPMKEPKNVLSAIFLSIPFMIFNGLISIGVINIFSNLTLKEFGFTSNTISIYINIVDILLIVLLLIVHELLHLIFIPNFIKSEKTIIGLSWFGGFVATEEKIEKSRFIWITIAPFIIISVILPLVLSFCGLLTSTMKFLILLNSMGSCVDVLILLLIIKQVPQDGTLKSNGQKTYWKNKQSDFNF